MRLTLACAVLCLAVSHAFGQRPESTVDVMSKHVQSWAMQRFASNSDVKTVVLDVQTQTDKAWLETLMAAYIQPLGITVVRRDSGQRRRVIIEEASTKYEPTEHVDTVTRLVTLRLREEHVLSDGTVNVVGVGYPSLLQRKELMARNDAVMLESTQYASTHGTLPERQHTFWDDVLEPAIYVGAAVVTVVLLFTVRSQ